MNMLVAIALSTSNKARAHNNERETIIVEERYTGGLDRWWFHVWHLKNDEDHNEYVFAETDIASNMLHGIKKFFGVNPEDQIWSRI